MTYAAVTSTEIFTLVEAIDLSCRTRGVELALPEELARELLAMRTAQAALNSRLDMNARIQACLNDYQADLIAEGAPGGRTDALRESWQRFQAASHAFSRRVKGTADEGDQCARELFQFLSQVRTLVDQGVV